MVVTKELPGDRWLEVLTQADCKVEICGNDVDEDGYKLVSTSGRPQNGLGMKCSTSQSMETINPKDTTIKNTNTTEPIIDNNTTQQLQQRKRIRKSELNTNQIQNKIIKTTPNKSKDVDNQETTGQTVDGNAADLQSSKGMRCGMTVGDRWDPNKRPPHTQGSKMGDAGPTSVNPPAYSFTTSSVTRAYSQGAEHAKDLVGGEVHRHEVASSGDGTAGPER